MNSSRRNTLGTLRLVSTALSMVAVMLLAGCGQTKTVTRVEPDEVTDLSGDWNDTDSRLVAEEMIKDVLNRPWLESSKEKQNSPVVIVGTVRNRTAEHIATTAFIKNLELANQRPSMRRVCCQQGRTRRSQG